MRCLPLCAIPLRVWASDEMEVALIVSAARHDEGFEESHHQLALIHLLRLLLLLAQAFLFVLYPSAAHAEAAHAKAAAFARATAARAACHIIGSALGSPASYLPRSNARRTRSNDVPPDPPSSITITIIIREATITSSRGVPANAGGAR